MPSLLANPYLLTGVGAVAIMTHGVAYLQGRDDGAAYVVAKHERASEKTLRALRRGERAIDELNGAHARARNHQDSENRSIRNAAKPLIARPIYTAACVDADGIGLLDRARATANSAIDTGESSGTSAGAASLSAQ